MSQTPLSSYRRRQIQASRLRARIEADIEQLIFLLDNLDGDPDFEPSISSPAFRDSTVDLEGDFSDYEPSLGWSERTPRLDYWTPAWETMQKWAVQS